jgi:predicted nucleotidyltransferase component of viral defense system
MAITELHDFFLVGGTNLALRYGHRTSVDLDFFSISVFNNEDIFKILEKNFKGFTYQNRQNPIGVFGFIDGVKVDFVKHHYFKQIDNPIVFEGIRMYGDKDLMAMKIFAILKRASKKDFWDLAELFQYYSLDQMIDAFNLKYPSNQLLISIPHAISYFTDAEESEDPISLKGQTWESVKDIIKSKVREYLS